MVMRKSRLPHNPRKGSYKVPNKFQRRHYQAIADVLVQMRQDANEELFTESIITTLEDALVQTFTRDNPRFKPTLFLAASRKPVS